VIKDIVNKIHPLSDRSFDLILALICYEEHEKGDTFIQLNKPDKKEYFLVEGICKSFVTNHDGEDVTLAFYQSKGVLPPNATRTANNVSLCSFKSLSKLVLASVDAALFTKLMIENDEIRYFGNVVIRNELIKKTEKEIGLASLNARERLQKFRNDFPAFENKVPHTDIASYLGITSISLSRLRREMLK
jgi:CRP-like cAMP-binding protein